MKRKSSSFYISVLIITIVAFFAVGCKVSEKTTLSKGGKEPGAGNNMELEMEMETELEMEPLPQGPLSPYTGTVVDEVFPVPFCVLIENHPRARPQAGLGAAGLVYEVPVEGGYTRFLAVYASPYKGEIGPVRSSRPYFAGLIQEHDGIMAHCGYSIHTEDVLKKIKLRYIDERFNPQYYRREKSRKMPHNLYTTLEKLLQGAENKGFLQKQGKTISPCFTFSETHDQAESELASNIEIKFSSTDRVEYRKNALNGYTRYHNGALFLDAETDEGITVNNIIVQFVHTRIFTSEGHLNITLVGEGEGLFFSGGAAREIRWKKDGEQERTVFSDENGEITLSPGKTWIHLVPRGSKVNWSP